MNVVLAPNIEEWLRFCLHLSTALLEPAPALLLLSDRDDDCIMVHLARDLPATDHPVLDKHSW